MFLSPKIGRSNRYNYIETKVSSLTQGVELTHRSSVACERTILNITVWID